MQTVLTNQERKAESAVGAAGTGWSWLVAGKCLDMELLLIQSGKQKFVQAAEMEKPGVTMPPCNPNLRG